MQALRLYLGGKGMRKAVGEGGERVTCPKGNRKKLLLSL